MNAHAPGAYVGRPRRDSVIFQGAEPHGRRLVGRGKGTFHGVGCAVCAVTTACLYLEIPGIVSPLDVQRLGLARPGVWSPGSSGANIPELCRAAGLRVGVDNPGPGKSEIAGVLRPLILSCLKSGGIVLCGVDFKGSPVTDHWGCAPGHDDVRLYVDDPATADHESVDLRTLTGPVVWGGVAQPYRVARVITLWKS